MDLYIDILLERNSTFVATFDIQSFAEFKVWNIKGFRRYKD